MQKRTTGFHKLWMAETWPLRESKEGKLEAFKIGTWRILENISRTRKMHNDKVLKRVRQ